MSALLALRVPKNLLMLPIEAALLYFGMKLVLRLYHALPGTVETKHTAKNNSL